MPTCHYYKEECHPSPIYFPLLTFFTLFVGEDDEGVRRSPARRGTDAEPPPSRSRFRSRGNSGRLMDRYTDNLVVCLSFGILVVVENFLLDSIYVFSVSECLVVNTIRYQFQYQFLCRVN